MGDDGLRSPRPHGWCYFYPRPPYGGRLLSISIVYTGIIFLSTSPVWGTTPAGRRLPVVLTISIHVPRMGDDGRFRSGWTDAGYFYPRPPYGGRPGLCQNRIAFFSISIHVPRMGDDKRGVRKSTPPRTISIHVPRMGDDGILSLYAVKESAFLSTSPVWGTTHDEDSALPQGIISIHVPRMGDDASQTTNRIW